MKSKKIRNTVLFVSQRYIQFWCIIWSFKISYTMCYLIYCNIWWYIWPVRCKKNRRTVLDVSQWSIQVCCIILLVKNGDNICYLIYSDNWWYIWSLKSEWIRKTVLAVSQESIMCVKSCYQWKIRHCVLANLPR